MNRSTGAAAPDAPARCRACAAAEVGFCAGLAAARLDAIAQVARSQRLGRGRAAQRPQPGEALVVRAGAVKLTHLLADGRRQIVDLLRAGDVLLGCGCESAGASIEVEAVTDAELCRFPAERLAIIDEAGDDGALLAAAGAEIVRKNRQIVALGRLRADERLAWFLLDFAARDRPSGDDAIALVVSRAEIADILCLTKETVSRVFSQLRARRLIALDGPDRVMLRNPEALARLAMGDGPAEAA